MRFRLAENSSSLPDSLSSVLRPRLLVGQGASLAALDVLRLHLIHALLKYRKNQLGLLLSLLCAGLQAKDVRHADGSSVVPGSPTCSSAPCPAASVSATAPCRIICVVQGGWTRGSENAARSSRQSRSLPSRFGSPRPSGRTVDGAHRGSWVATAPSCHAAWFSHLRLTTAVPWLC